MRKLFSTALLAGLLVAFGSDGNAQPQGKGKGGQGGGFGQRGQGGGFGFGGAGGGARASVASLSVNASVQEEIKATDEQKEKLKTISEETAAKQTELFKDGGGGDRGSLKDLSREELQKRMQDRQKEIQPKQNAIREEAEKKIGEVLKPEQFARVKQISHQQMGMAIFTDEATAKELKVTEEQKEKFKVLSEEYAKDQRELRGGGRSQGGDNKGGENKGGQGKGGFGQGKGGFGGGFGQTDPETQKKLDALKAEFVGKAVAVLNDEQKGVYKKMTGDAFTVKFEQRRPMRKDD